MVVHGLVVDVAPSDVHGPTRASGDIDPREELGDGPLTLIAKARRGGVAVASLVGHVQLPLPVHTRQTQCQQCTISVPGLSVVTVENPWEPPRTHHLNFNLETLIKPLSTTTVS